jgi:hypothetical protein
LRAFCAAQHVQWRKPRMHLGTSSTSTRRSAGYSPVTDGADGPDARGLSGCAMISDN